MGQIVIPKGIPVEFWPYASKTFNERQRGFIEHQCYHQPYMCTDSLALPFRGDNVADKVKLVTFRNNKLIMIQDFEQTVKYEVLIEEENFHTSLNGWFNAQSLPNFLGGGSVQPWTHDNVNDRAVVTLKGDSLSHGSAKSSRRLTKQYALNKGRHRIKMRAYFGEGTEPEQEVSIYLHLMDSPNGQSVKSILLGRKYGVTADGDYRDLDVYFNVDRSYAYFGLQLSLVAAANPAPELLVGVDDIEVQSFKNLYLMPSVLPAGDFDVNFNTEDFPTAPLCNSLAKLEVIGPSLPEFNALNWVNDGGGFLWNFNSGIPVATIAENVDTSWLKTKRKYAKGKYDFYGVFQLPYDGFEYDLYLRGVDNEGNDLFEIPIKQNMSAVNQDYILDAPQVEIPVDTEYVALQFRHVSGDILASSADIAILAFDILAPIYKSDSMDVRSEWEDDAHEGTVLIKYRAKTGLNRGEIEWDSTIPTLQIRLRGRFAHEEPVSEMKSFTTTQSIITTAMQIKETCELQLDAVPGYMRRKILYILQHVAGGTFVLPDPDTGEEVEWSCETPPEGEKLDEFYNLKPMTIILTKKNSYTTAVI
jgi:hypothetical protein